MVCDYTVVYPKSFFTNFKCLKDKFDFITVIAVVDVNVDIPVDVVVAFHLPPQLFPIYFEYLYIVGFVALQIIRPTRHLNPFCFRAKCCGV